MGSSSFRAPGPDGYDAPVAELHSQRVGMARPNRDLSDVGQRHGHRRAQAPQCSEDPPIAVQDDLGVQQELEHRPGRQDSARAPSDERSGVRTLHPTVNPKQQRPLQQDGQVGTPSPPNVPVRRWARGTSAEAGVDMRLAGRRTDLLASLHRLDPLDDAR